jgi:hypothetical protein
VKIRTVNYFRATFYAALMVCAIVLAIDLHRLMPKAAAALDNVQRIEVATENIEISTERTEKIAAGLINQVRDIARDEHKAEADQLARTQALSMRAETLLRDADVTMKDLDASAKQLGRIGATTNEAIAGIAADAHVTLGRTQIMLDAATADLSDPALKQSLAHIDEASENLAIATKEASGAMKDIHQATTYELKQITAPVSKVKAAALFTASILRRLFF